MQHVDMETGDRIWNALKEIGVKYVPGGSAANTITCTSIFGMPSGYIGKIGDDELGHLFKSTMEQFGVRTTMLQSEKSSGRCMVFITGANAERTFADYMGAALEMGPDDLRPEYFKGYDYFHIEGYLVQNQDLIAKAVQMAKEAGCIISIDMASYNVVESNNAFLHNLIDKYVDIVFANESECRAFTKVEGAVEGLRDRGGQGRQGRQLGEKRGRRILYTRMAGESSGCHRSRRHLCCRLHLRTLSRHAPERMRGDRLHNRSQGG